MNQILVLKSISTMRDEFAAVIQRTIGLESAELYIREGDSLRFQGRGGAVLHVDSDIEDWFLGADHLADRYMVDTNPYYALIRDKLNTLFESSGCYYIVPMMQNGILSGLLLLGSKQNGKLIRAGEVAFINNVRTAGAIALSNSALFQDLTNMKDHLEVLVADRTKKLQARNDQMFFELRLARTVQQSILPATLPQSDEIVMAARMIPLMEVSGDFYYVIRLHQDRYGIAIVDVSGHGMPAALLTSMIKTEIDNQFTDGRSTADVCSRLGMKLAPALSETGSYFTLFLAVVDIRKREMEYTGCGHVSPVLLRKREQILMLDSDGVVVGSALHGSYETLHLTLEPEDHLYLYTDGLLDAIDDTGEAFGEERLQAAILSRSSLPVEGQLKGILDEVNEFRRNSAGRRADDITLLIMGLGGEAAFSKKEFSFSAGGAV